MIMTDVLLYSSRGKNVVLITTHKHVMHNLLIIDGQKSETPLHHGKKYQKEKKVQTGKLENYKLYSMLDIICYFVAFFNLCQH
jgi:hypothetical protein